jgi:hypothetical protein
MSLKLVKLERARKKERLDKARAENELRQVEDRLFALEHGPSTDRQATWEQRNSLPLTTNPTRRR